MSLSSLKTNSSLKEWILFIFIMSAVFFIFGDDEPLVEFSDWSFIQILFVVLSTLSVFAENVYRGIFGFFTSKDRALMDTTLSYSMSITLYFIVIVFISCAHLLQPLELDMFDNLEPFSGLLVGSVSDYCWFLLIYFCLYLTLAILHFMGDNWSLNTVLLFLTVSFLVFCVASLFTLLNLSLHGLTSYTTWASLYNPASEPFNPQVHFEPRGCDLFE